MLNEDSDQLKLALGISFCSPKYPNIEQFSQIIYHYLLCSPKYSNILAPLSLQTPAICGVWRETADWED